MTLSGHIRETERARETEREIYKWNGGNDSSRKTEGNSLECTKVLISNNFALPRKWQRIESISGYKNKLSKRKKKICMLHPSRNSLNFQNNNLFLNSFLRRKLRRKLRREFGKFEDWGNLGRIIRGNDGIWALWGQEYWGEMSKEAGDSEKENYKKWGERNWVEMREGEIGEIGEGEMREGESRVIEEKLGDERKRQWRRN